MLSLFTLPSASSSIDAISAYSSPWFSAWLPYVLALTGIILAGLLVSFIMRTVIEGFNRLFGHDTRSASIKKIDEYVNK